MKVQRQIEWGECDAAGIVFYPNFYRWMDATFHEWTRSIGFDQTTFTDEHRAVVTPLAESQCDFISPGRFYDVLTITLNLTALGQSSMTIDYIFTVDERLIATGREVRVFVVNKGAILSKIAIPHDIRAALEGQIA